MSVYLYGLFFKNWFFATVNIVFIVFTICNFTIFTAAADEFTQTVKRVKRSVVAVGTKQATRRPPARLLATGFVVADGMHVITNAHVIPEHLNARRKETLTVFAGVGGAVDARQATLVAEDREHDLALLAISGPPLPSLRLGDDGTVAEGQSIAFTGFPIGAVLGLYAVTHKGIVSALTPFVIPAFSSQHLDSTMIKRLRKPLVVFQLDAIAYPGNSGSPLYDPETGAVYGVVSSVFVKESKEKLLQDPSGIAYAIPIRHAIPLLDRINLKN